MTGEFPSQRSSNAENASIWWRHHDYFQLIIHFTNDLENEAATLHMHGLEQRGTPWMDGAGTVSHCPINPGETFTYRYEITTDNGARYSGFMITLQWRHNGRDGVSNHKPHGCLLNCLFRRRSKKTSKFRVTGLCAGNSPETSNAENVSIWWRHHESVGLFLQCLHRHLVVCLWALIPHCNVGWPNLHCCLGM